MRISPWITFGAALCASTLLAGGGGLRAEENILKQLAEGKKRFETQCSTCHSLDKPFAKEMPREEWDKLLVDMAGRGAKISPEDTVLIVDYLSTKSLFSSKCTVCHTREKVFDRTQTLAEWQATVKKMAEKKPDLFTPGELKALSAYLVLVLGPPAGAGEK